MLFDTIEPEISHRFYFLQNIFHMSHIIRSHNKDKINNKLCYVRPLQYFVIVLNGVGKKY